MIIYLVEPARHRRRGEEKVSVGGGAFRDSGFGIRDSREIRETHLQQFLLFLSHRLGHFVRPAREGGVRRQRAETRPSPERRFERKKSRKVARLVGAENGARGRISPVERRKPSRVTRVRGLITPNTRWRPRTRLLVIDVLGCIHHFRRGAFFVVPGASASRERSERE